MAIYCIWLNRNRSIFNWKILCRKSPFVSQPYHSTMLSRSLQETSSICEGKARICGRSTLWLRNTSSSQINSFSLHQSNMNKLNITSPSFKHSFFNTKCVRPSVFFSNILIYRSFHVKNVPNKNSNPNIPKKSEKKRKQREKKSWYTNESPFVNSIYYGVAAALCTAYMFAIPNEIQQGLDHCLKLLEESEINITGVQLVASAIVFMNIILFLLWRTNLLELTLMQYATTNIVTGKKLFPLFLSMFSHKSLVHLTLNMYVLLSFAEAWTQYSQATQHKLPKDVTSGEKFLAFYLSAGFVASVGSIIAKMFGNVISPSLGASGAIYGLVGYICSTLPNSRLAIAFLPNFTFSAKDGLTALAMMDMIGLAFCIATRWRYALLDHAGHLSGLFFGIWYAKHGEVMLYHYSKYIVKKKQELIEDIFGKRR